jgi:hypothetical protein
MLALLRRIAIDVSPLRESREFRLLVAGQIVSNLGTQAALVALPYQIFVLSHSAALVGLLGAFELGPMVVVSLLGGALNDRMDRRRLLALAQFGVIVAAGALAVSSLAGHPPVALVLVLGGLLAGSVSLDTVTRTAIIPATLSESKLGTGLALNYGLYQATGIIGPALGGLLIAASSVGVAYVIDAATCLAMLWAALSVGVHRPDLAGAVQPIGRAIAEGLRFVRSSNALSGSFAIDLVAMTFGWPRSLFAVLSLTVYHSGAGGTGLLYAALAAGGTLAILTSGWLSRTRRLGRVVVVAVAAWGAAIAGMGIVGSIAPAMALLCVAGYADGVSAFCRSVINQTITPDWLRGRMSSVYSLVVTSGPRLGDIESGLVAGLTSAATSMATGGLACIVGLGAILVAFPDLVAYDSATAGAADGAAGADAARAAAAQPAPSTAAATESGASSAGQ